MKNVKIYILIIISIGFSNCKTASKSVSKSNEKSEMNFIYYFHEANSLRLKGFSTEAVEYYLKALEFNEKSAAANYFLARTYVEQTDFEKALFYSQKAVENNNSNYFYKILLTEVYINLKKFSDAEKVLKQLIDEYPQIPDFYDFFAQLFQITKNLQGLQNAYELKVKTFPEDFNSYVQLFGVYKITKPLSFQLNFIENLIVKFPDNIHFKALKAEVLFKSGNISEAEQIYNSFNEYLHDDFFLLESYINFALQTKQKKKFNELLGILIQSNSVSYETKTKYIIPYVELQPDSTDLHKILLQFVNVYPEKDLPNTLLADFYVKNADFKNASFYLRKAAMLRSDDMNLILTLFEADINLKNYKKLYEDAVFFTDYFPNSPTVWQYRGYALFMLKKNKQALEELDYGNSLVIENNKQKSIFHFYIATVYEDEKNYFLSDYHFEKMLYFDNTFYYGISVYAENLSKRNVKLDYAEMLIDKCLNSQEIYPKYFDVKAWILFKKADYDSASLLINKALSFDKNNPIFIEHCGDILFMKSETENALNYWNISLENNPDAEILKLQISDYDKMPKQEFYNKFLKFK